MKRFRYIAKDDQDKKQEGFLEAETKDAVLDTLRKKSLTPISIREEKVNIFTKIKDFSIVSSSEKVMFSKELATLVGAGIPIAQSMHVLEEQVESKTMKKAATEIANDIEGGFSLSAAMEKQHRIFGPLYVSMIRAGEVGGILDQTLEKMADEIEKEHELVAKIRGALAYPGVIMIALTLVVIYMITSIIPQIAKVFSEMGGELPWSTRFLMSLSDAFRSYGVLILIGLASLVFGFRTALKKSYRFRFIWHTILLKIPIFGKTAKKVNVARFTRTLGSLLSSGVAVIEALQISADTLSNEVFKKEILYTARKVEDGSSVAEPLKRSKIFPKMVPHMISVGEETGTLDKTLLKVTEFYDKEVDNTVKNLSSILEPLLMIVIGLGAGFIVISVITPIYQMSTLF
jgi:type IV pilus assembly protein PilC